MVFLLQRCAMQVLIIGAHISNRQTTQSMHTLKINKLCLGAEVDGNAFRDSPRWWKNILTIC